MRMWSWCGKEMSAAKRPRPVTSGGSSRRVTDSPNTLAFSGRMSCSHLGRRRAHRREDVGVARAAAEVRRQHVGEVLVIDVRLALEHAGGEHQEAGRAIAALQAVMLHEGTLEGV